MPTIGWFEILLVVFIAIVVVGPKDFPILLKKTGFAHCFPKYLTEYQIRKKSLQSNRLKNLYWMWRINKNLNKFNILQNFISIFFISINSIKKYGFR